MGKRDVLFVAGGAVALAGCALVLGIDDVDVKPDGGSGVDAAAGEDSSIANDGSIIVNDALVLDDINVPFVDSAIFADGPVTTCTTCLNGTVNSECALACDEPLPIGLAVDDNDQNAYFTNLGILDGGAVFQVIVSGGGQPSLILDAGNSKPGDIAYSAPHKLVFYGLNAANAIGRSDGGPTGASLWVSSTAPTTLRTASGGTNAGGRVFILSGSTLTECDVDNCGAPHQFTGGNVIDFSIQDSIGRIGWSETANSAVYYGDLAGATSTALVTNQTGVHHVAINSGDPTTYAWSVDVSPGVAQIRDNGVGTTTSTMIFNGQSVGGMQFSSDDGTLYFTDTLAGVVYARTSAGALTVFADKEDAPGEIAVTAEWVLWVAGGLPTRASGRIMRKHR